MIVHADRRLDWAAWRIWAYRALRLAVLIVCCATAVVCVATGHQTLGACQLVIGVAAVLPFW